MTSLRLSSVKSWIPGGSLRANFLWLFLGNTFHHACFWSIMIVLAKRYDTAMVGEFAESMAVTAPIVMFANLQLRQVLMTDARGEFSPSDYMGLRWVSLGLAFVVILGLAAFRRGGGLDMGVLILLVGISKCLESMSDLMYGVLQRHERMGPVALSIAAKGLLGLLLVGVTVFIASRIVWVGLALAATQAVILLAYDAPQAKALLRSLPSAMGAPSSSLAPSFEWTAMMRLLKVSLPLGFVMMLISLRTNVPVFFLTSYCGHEDLGVFALLAQPQMVGLLVVLASGQAVVPRMAKRFVDDIRSFQWLALKLMGIGTIMGLLGVGVALIAGRPILSLLYRPEYAQHKDLFVLLMAVGWLGYMTSCLGCAMTAARRFTPQMPLAMGSVGAISLTCFILVPRWGMTGAALGQMAGYLIEILGGAWVVRSAIRSGRST